MKRVVFAVIVLLLSTLASLAIGAGTRDLHDLWSWLIQDIDPTKAYLFSEFRLPRTSAALSVGAALAISGTLLQTLLRNPLSEPYTIGLSGGATLGAVTVLFLWPQAAGTTISLGAFIGCWISALIVLALIRRRTLAFAENLILVGVMLSLFCGALVSLGFALFAPLQLQKALYWMMGAFGTERDHVSFMFFPIVLALLIFWSTRARTLDRLSLGDELARNFGLNLARARMLLIFTVTILTAFSVSIGGLIGFVGLVSPHIASRILGHRRHAALLPFAACIGASLVASADALGRALGGDTEIPVGGIIALIGAPLLITQILSRRRHG